MPLEGIIPCPGHQLDLSRLLGIGSAPLDHPIKKLSDQAQGIDLIIVFASREA
jgi:hypothetical protein